LRPTWLHEEHRLTLAPRSWAHIFFLWLALATIFSNALDPSGSPLQKRSGSAFNPFTSDVALGPKRVAAIGEDRKDPGVSSEGTGRADAVQTDLPLAFATFVLPFRTQSAGGPPPTAASRPSGGLASRGFLARAPPFA
jgi:hypothetical protein